MTSYAAHIITADAVALGDPCVVVIAHSDDSHTSGDPLIEYPLAEDQDPETVLTQHGWANPRDRGTVETGYYTAVVDPADWLTIVAEVSAHEKAATIEQERQYKAYTLAVTAAMHSGLPGAAVAEAAGRSTSRVYQVRDGRR